MHRWLAPLLVLAVVGCTPRGIQGTLGDLNTLGFTCGDGIADNVPSGLTQWSCRSDGGGPSTAVDIDGNGQGVTELTVVVESTDLAVAKQSYRRIAGAVAPLTQAPALLDVLSTWAGPQELFTVGSAKVAAECDATQCIIDIDSVDGPLQPLRLP